MYQWGGQRRIQSTKLVELSGSLSRRPVWRPWSDLPPRASVVLGRMQLPIPKKKPQLSNRQHKVQLFGFPRSNSHLHRYLCVEALIPSDPTLQLVLSLGQWSLSQALVPWCCGGPQEEASGLTVLFKCWGLTCCSSFRVLCEGYFSHL